MRHDRFQNLVEEQMKICYNTLFKKSAEYSTDDDKLHNFKKAGELWGTKPETALFGMYLKHFVSLKDIVQKIEDDNQYPNIGMLTEKITDSINYLLLLKALIIGTELGGK